MAFERRLPQGELVAVRPAPVPPGLAVRHPWLFSDAMALSAVLAAGLGLVLGLLAATDALPGERWTGAVQAHRGVQLLGWAAVFLCALAFEFVVRLNQSRALPELWRLMALALLAAGALFQGVGQLFHAELGWLWLPGTVLSLAGAAIAAVLIWTVRPGFAPGSRFHSFWLRLAMLWLVVLTAGGAAAAVRGSDGVAKLDDAQLLTEIFIRGFVMSAVIGIALRAFPGHLGLAAVSWRRQAVTMAGINLSLLLWAAASGAFGLPEWTALQRASDLLLALTLLFATWSLGVLAAFRPDWTEPRYQLLLPWAWSGLVWYAAVLAVVAVLPGWDGRTIYETGAVRHLFLLGFMAPLMIAMAHIVLARFGTGELVAPATLLWAFLLTQIAWPLRVLPPLFDGSPGSAGKGIMGLGGVLAICGLALLAVAAARTSSALRRRNRWSKLPSLLGQP